MSEIEIRELEFEVRVADEETRSVSGVAVPYNQTINVGGFQERVERGAFDTSKTVPLLFAHDHRSIPIGKVTSLRDTEHGLEIDAKLNDTSQAEDVYRALKAGDLNKFSIGFVPVKSRNEDDVIVRTKVDLKEISVVPFPAYSNASVTQVREAESNKEKENNRKNMENVNDYSTEINELRDSVSDLGRKFDKFNEGGNEGQSFDQYRSGGEYLKGLANGEKDARDIATRDFATSVEADNIRPTWVNNGLKLIDKQRVVKGLFTESPLPKTGNSIEYPYVKTQTGDVAQQVAEGDNLAYLELAIDTATAPVKLYGGYSSLSRQAIERSDVAYLESVLRFQTMQYANATEKAVQDALVATAATANEVELGGTAGAATAKQWLEAIIDAKAEIDDNSALGLSADFILVSRDVAKKVALLTDTAGRPVFAVNSDGQNTWGSMPLNGRLAGVIDGTPVVVGKNLAANTVVVASSAALVSFESAGAPFRLQDENIVNLTKDFSLYGYLAIAVQDVKGITFIVDEA